MVRENLESQVARPEQKWFFQIWMVRSAALRQWLCRGTRWKAKLYFLKGSLFEFVGAFIVEDVEFGGISVRLELVVETGPARRWSVCWLGES